MRWWAVLSLALACRVEGDVGADARSVDDDLDGFSEREGDCNDRDPAVAPGFPEACDGVDDDCDGEVDGAVCARQESFASVARLDLLLVVDNTESMRDEHLRLVDGVGDLVPHLLGDGRDVHVGVITTDLGGDGGVLRRVDGKAWIEAGDSASMALDWLSRAVDVGTGGDPVEQARAAAFAAVEIRSQDDNAGFRRADADLSLLIVSDEDDASAAPTLEDFLGWLNGGPGLDRASAHAVVSTEPLDACGSGAWGQQHLSLVELTGGTWLSICEEDYGPFLAALAQFNVLRALPRRFPLEETADPTSIAVEVHLTTGFVDTLDAGRFAYDAVNGEVVIIDDQAPPAGSTVVVRYRAVP